MLVDVPAHMQHGTFDGCGAALWTFWKQFGSLVPVVENERAAGPHSIKWIETLSSVARINSTHQVVLFHISHHDANALCSVTGVVERSYHLPNISHVFDSGGDGIGDLNGTHAKLDYLTIHLGWHGVRYVSIEISFSSRFTLA